MTGKKIKKRKSVLILNKTEGFALFYVLLIVGVVAIATTIFLETALGELVISADREESDVAFYAAESGVECALFLQTKYGAFNMRKEKREYACDSDSESSFYAGWKTDDRENLYLPNKFDTCYRVEEDNLPYGLLDYGVNTYEPFVIFYKDGPACARVTVEVLSVSDDEGTDVRCEIYIRSEGASKCNADGTPEKGSVQRVRIESYIN